MKQTRKPSKLFKLSAVALLALPAFARGAEEWPQWRGPKGDSIVRDAGLLQKWPEGGPKKLWTVPAGVGFASPVGFEGKVYLFSLEGGNKETLAALNAADGKPLWSQSYDIGRSPDYEGTRATPTIENGRIYTYGSTGVLCARNLADGKELWRLDVLKETNAKPITWGQASSPTVLGDLVYVQGGSGGPVAVAVDKNSGKFAWKSEVGLGGYAAVTVCDVAGGQQLAVFGGKALYGLDPKSGATLWKEPWVTKYDVNAATPIFHEGKVFISSGYLPDTGGSALFDLSGGKAKKVWEQKGPKGIGSKFQPQVLDNGYVYGVSEEKQGVLKCQKWETGEIAWTADEPKKLGFGGALVRFGDKMIVTSHDGPCYLVLATPQKCELISQFELFPRPSGQSKHWATPVIYQGKMYAKGEKELVCLDVSGK